METRLEQQIAFLRELDKLKQVYRQSPLMDNSRKENSAEHSWHVALAALVLAPLADEPVDINRVIKMLLLHDVVEIDAGDTFAYDPVRRLDQAAREEAAAQRLFGLLPEAQAAEFRALWEEFDARATADARFAHAVDRLLPVLHNYATGGGAWKAHQLHWAHVVQRVSAIQDGSAALWGFVAALLDDAVAQGYLAPAP
ncbi:MAG TPA: HD domain-containing protein [Caldilineaceae bacterium]|nr:HD domain-containing protein [Caldilineaceae bacterium]